MKAKSLRGEWIGKEIEIDGRHGIVVDETKNTLKVEIDGEEKTFAKETHYFTLTIDGKKVTINGKDVTARPQDRIKKKFR